MKNPQEALQVLQGVPAKQRTPKINMALAKMFQEQGMERSAIATYKEVLRECPLTLEAAEGLSSLGVKGIEVNSIIMSCNWNLQNFDWLNAWIKAHAHINCKEYSQAVTTLRSLDNVNCSRDNHNLLVTMGECYYLSGNYKNSLLCLRRARLIEPDSIKGLDIYAANLHQAHHVAELEKLISFISSSNECSSETYTAMAYALLSLHKLNRANTIANQVIRMSPDYVEAYILRGNILIEQKKFQDALHHFRQALQLKQQVMSHQDEKIEHYSLIYLEDDHISPPTTPCGPTKGGDLMFRPHVYSNNPNAPTSPWEAGYFKLKGGVVYMFTDNNQRLPKRAIPLKGGLCQGCRRIPNSHRPHTFEILLKPNKAYQFAAPNEYVASEWLQSFVQSASGLFD
ncbi:hypothetical protein QAD02_013884 [Eretmocerus hayati]|uniref:Uncharacterized protein n=1 Tax=Eretmocerus hayati TaxID=131215 RepID=A0ACC2P3X9_9HYME|nr:hypothetical protein QAD02_013884 [Eretmocerus hayati]